MNIFKELNNKPHAVIVTFTTMRLTSIEGRSFDYEVIVRAKDFNEDERKYLNLKKVSEDKMLLSHYLTPSELIWFKQNREELYFEEMVTKYGVTYSLNNKPFKKILNENNLSSRAAKF